MTRNWCNMPFGPKLGNNQNYKNIIQREHTVTHKQLFSKRWPLSYLTLNNYIHVPSRHIEGENSIGTDTQVLPYTLDKAAEQIRCVFDDI